MNSTTSRIDGDVFEAGKGRRRNPDEKAQGPIGEAQPGDSAKQAEKNTFHQKLAGDLGRTSAQSSANGKLLLAPFGADQKQVGYVGARDEQHHADTCHQHPQHFAQVAHYVLFQRPQIGRECVRHRIVSR